MLEIKTKGLEELQRDLNHLAAKVEPKALVNILREEARSFRQKLLPRVPVGPTGNLRKGARYWTPRINTRHPDAMARSGMYLKIAPHANIVEYGTVERYTTSGAYRGVMPARYFFSPLAQQEMPGILSRIIKRIYDIIGKEWR